MLRAGTAPVEVRVLTPGAAPPAIAGDGTRAVPPSAPASQRRHRADVARAAAFRRASAMRAVVAGSDAAPAAVCACASARSPASMHFDRASSRRAGRVARLAWRCGVVTDQR